MSRVLPAYRRFGELLRERAFQLTTRLAEGDLVLFDNQRILHGRTGSPRRATRAICAAAI